MRAGLSAVLDAAIGPERSPSQPRDEQIQLDQQTVWSIDLAAGAAVRRIAVERAHGTFGYLVTVDCVSLAGGLDLESALGLARWLEADPLRARRLHNAARSGPIR